MVRVLFSLYFSLAFFSFARAQQIPCGFVHKVEFQSAAEGLQSLGKPLSLMSAAVQLHVSDPRGGQPDSCSGSFISDDGDLLTASHCLDRCRFKEDGSLKTDVTTCQVKINGVMQDMEIVKAGACSHKISLDAMELQNQRQSMDSLPVNCRGGAPEDYAVLHPKNKSAFGNFSCLPLSPAKPNLQDGVFAITYPTSTGRAYGGVKDPNEKDAKGDTLSFSSGRVVSKSTCTVKWQAQNVQKLFYGSAIQGKEMDMSSSLLKWYGGKIQTTVDFVPGSSGGPLLNSKGEIVGVVSTSMSTLQNNYHECRGSTIFEPVPKMKDLNLKSTCRARQASPGQGI